MAAQVGISYSSSVFGFGSFAAGAYGCYNSTSTERISCFNSSTVDINAINRTMVFLNNSGAIDPLTNLNKSKIVIYTGTGDKIVQSNAAKIGYDILRDYFHLNATRF